MKLLSPHSKPLRLLIGFLAVSSLSLATTITYDRSLPTTLNSNSSTAANRSNVDWGNVGGGVSGGGFLNGDNFNLGVSSTGFWYVNTISVWVVLNNATDAPSDEFSDFKLYGGPESSPASFGLISTSYSLSRDRYIPSLPGGSCNDAAPSSGPAGENYLSRVSPTCLPIFKITFNVSLALASNTLYDFAADGTPLAGNIFLAMLRTLRRPVRLSLVRMIST